MNEMMLNTNNKKEIEVGVEFLGELNNIITYTTLSTTFGVTQGTLNTTAFGLQNKWLHFKIDGKELYVSKVAIRNNLSWDHLYSKGLVYGTNDNGLHPTGTATNQYKTIILNSKLYKCRLLKGANEGQDPYTHIPGVEVSNYDAPNTYTSEYSRLFYPIVTGDSNIKSYTGPTLANYTKEDLQLRYIDATVTPGVANWCQERNATDNSSRVFRGYDGPSRVGWPASSLISVLYGWRAVLELV